MQILSKTILLLLFFLLNYSCSRFELDDPAEVKVSTFKTVIGGTGYDVGLDVIQLKDSSFLIVGTSGPQCNITDAYAVKIDHKTGAVITSLRYGDTSQGVEENLQGVIQDPVTGDLYATGFRVPRLSPQSSDSCGYKEMNGDADIIVVKMNNNLEELEFDSINGMYNAWDAGNSLLAHNGKIYITGHYEAKLSMLEIDKNNLVIKSSWITKLQNDHGYGAVLDIIVNHLNQAVLVGQSGGRGLGNTKDKPLNTYFAIKDFSSQIYGVESYFEYTERDVSEGIAVVQMEEDNSYRIAVKAYNVDTVLNEIKINDLSGQIVLLKLNSDGMSPEFIPIPIGTNDKVYDMIKVKDGLVMAGSTNVQTENHDDILLMKVDFDGNLIWYRNFHLAIDGSFSVIEAYDEGFVIVGDSKKESGDFQSILIYKTDKEGIIQE